MKSDTFLIGKFIDFANNDRYAEVYISKTWQGKTKKYMLKVIGEQKVSEAQQVWDLYKNTDIKVSYGLSECSEFKGKTYPSTPIIWGFNVAESDEKPEPEKAEKQAEPHQTEDDDESDLPF